HAPDAHPSSMRLYLFPEEESDVLLYEFANAEGGTHYGSGRCLQGPVPEQRYGIRSVPEHRPVRQLRGICPRRSAGSGLPFRTACGRRRGRTHDQISRPLVECPRRKRAYRFGRSTPRAHILPRRIRLSLPDTHPACGQDRKSTRLNSSHVSISYAVFCLKKKNKT